MKIHLTNLFLMHVKPFATAPEPLKECDSPWSNVSTHALIQEEDILSICCELLIVKQYELNIYEIWDVYCAYVMSVVSTVFIVKIFRLVCNSSKAFVSGHIFVRMFSLFSCEDFSPEVFPNIRDTLCMKYCSAVFILVLLI